MHARNARGDAAIIVRSVPPGSTASTLTARVCGKRPAVRRDSNGLRAADQRWRHCRTRIESVVPPDAKAIELNALQPDVKESVAASSAR
jgi:hypothetical protein